MTNQSQIDKVKHQEDKLKWLEEESSLKLRLKNAQTIARINRVEANYWMRRHRNLKRSMTVKVRSRDNSITILQNLVTTMRTMMQQRASELSTSDRQLARSKRKLTASRKAKLNATDRATKTKKMLDDWKHKYNSVVDQLAESSEENVELKAEIIEWTEVAESMKSEYEEAINDLTPVTIRKVWVKNIGKPGECTIYTI